MNSHFNTLKKLLRETGDWKTLSHVPDSFLTPLKLENFINARREENRQAVILTSKPYHLVIEPTNVCNLKCPLCPTGSGSASREKGHMALADFKKIIDACADYTLELYLQNWGESTLLAHLPDMVRYAAGKGLWTHLSTNFSIEYKPGFLKQLLSSGLAYLAVDVDGLSQSVYEKYRRGGQLGRVLQNLKRALRIRKELNRSSPLIEVNMIAMRTNEHQLDEFTTFCKQLQVDAHTIGKLQINPNTMRAWLPKAQEHCYPSYRHAVSPSPCHWPWSGLVINWDGGVSPCCIVEDSQADFGNVFDEPVYKIWNNACFQSARAQFGDRNSIVKRTICNLCRNDTHNRNLPRVGDTFAIKVEPDI